MRKKKRKRKCLSELENSAPLTARYATSGPPLYLSIVRRDAHCGTLGLGFIELRETAMSRGCKGLGICLTAMPHSKQPHCCHEKRCKYCCASIQYVLCSTETVQYCAVLCVTTPWTCRVSMRLGRGIGCKEFARKWPRDPAGLRS